MIRLLCCALLISLPGHAELLADILARMDASARTFKSMSAKLKQVEYTHVIDETNEKSGEVLLKRGKAASTFLVQFQLPEPQVIHFDGHKLRVYYPKANTVEVYDVGKFTGKLNIDQVLLLGFGTSGAELTRAYAIKVAGAETLGSVPTTRLELTPKSQEVGKLVTKFELWIPEGQSNPVQEKALEPSKNYMLVTYTDLKVNPALPESAFALKLPPGVRTITPN